MITGPFKTLPVTITDPDLLATTQRLLDARLLHQIHNGDCLAITHNGLDILYQYAFVKKITGRNCHFNSSGIMF